MERFNINLPPVQMRCSHAIQCCYQSCLVTQSETDIFCPIASSMADVCRHVVTMMISPLHPLSHLGVSLVLNVLVVYRHCQ